MNVPGLQYPGHLDESTQDGAALKNIFDNLFYIRKLAENPVITTLPSSTVNQIQNIVQQTIISSSSSTSGIGKTIIGTHANRLAIYGASITEGDYFYEYDRKLLYIGSSSLGALIWTYLAGVMYDTFANRPTDFGTGDTGALYVPTEHLHWCKWGGSAWTILDDDGGTFKDSARALGTGYQVCDGTATSYLAVSGADLAQTVFTTPDEVSTPSVYHKSIAAYTGVINAASSPSTGAPSATTVVDNDLAVSTVAVGSATHTHTIAATAEPRNMGVLRYFRR